MAAGAPHHRQLRRLLVLLLANFFLLELVDDPRWGALGSTLLAALALVIAISDPDAGNGQSTPAR